MSGLWCTWAKIENYTSEFQNILKTNQDVASDVSYKCANYQLGIICILGYTKMTNVWI
jgi:hypothetical protein